MKILIVGPGRAGGALALAANAAGYEVVGAVARSPMRWELDLPVVTGAWPEAELVVIATRDGDIASAARDVEERHPPAAAVHLSGATGVSVLGALVGKGWKVGSFHPLQTLPDPFTGAAALSGAWVGITAVGSLRELLGRLASDLGMRAFDVADEARASYHAGAAAASNFLLGALDLAQRLFEQAGVPFPAAWPLAATVVSNAFELGPRPALTGPLARQDWDTIRRQHHAASELGQDARLQFEMLAKATAITAGVEIPSDLWERP